MGSFTASTGTYTNTTTGSGIQVSGLTLGVHTVKLTRTGGTNGFTANFDIITPIHSYKSNLYADLQNTLPVGSNAISDDRKLTPVKDILPVSKAWAQAIGVTASPTTSSTSSVPIPDMSCAVKTNGGRLRCNFNMTVSNNTSGGVVYCQIFVDGAAVGESIYTQYYAATALSSLSNSIEIPVSAGFHKIDVYWAVNGSQIATGAGINRVLTVSEI
jgi:hypothetical protein